MGRYFSFLKGVRNTTCIIFLYRVVLCFRHTSLQLPLRAADFSTPFRPINAWPHNFNKFSVKPQNIQKAGCGAAGFMGVTLNRIRSIAMNHTSF
eukprot:jgi/Botrbrau1/10153/Bobra.0121s0005.1